MRIAFCIDGMGVGGTEMNAVRTAEYLDHARFAITVVALNGEGPIRARYDAAGIPVESFPISSLYGASAWRQGMRLRRFLAERDIDVVHCHDLYSNAFVTPWARAAGVPAVITSRRWEIFERRAHAIANQLAYRLSNRVLANSPAVAGLLRAEGVPAARVAVVPNFVTDEALDVPPEIERPSRRAELGVPPGATVIGSVASLTPIKDHATLLRAFASLAPARPELHLVLVGDGPCRAALEVLATELGIASRVRFAGLRPNLPNLHHLFDLSALTSTSEGFPNSIVEAMAAGRAVVATNVGGVPDAVEHRVTGLLVPPGEPVPLAEALATLLDDDQRRRDMGTRGLARVLESYTADAALGTLGALYDTLVPRHSGAKGR